MSLTVPFCLDVFGELQNSDPAVRWRDEGDDFEASWHPDDASDRSWPVEGCRLLVEQSAQALERVLARHLGWEGNHRPVMRLERRGHSNTRPVWVLRNLTKWHDAPVLDDGPNFYTVLPAHISIDLDRLEALAAAVVWYARVERLLLDGGGASPGRLRKDGTCWVVDRGPGSQERLTVQPEPGNGYAECGRGITSWAICAMTSPIDVLAAIEHLEDSPTWAVTR